MGLTYLSGRTLNNDFVSRVGSSCVVLPLVASSGDGGPEVGKGYISAGSDRHGVLLMLFSPLGWCDVFCCCLCSCRRRRWPDA